MKNPIINNAEKDYNWKNEAKKRRENADWLELSFSIALKILRYLREEKKTQKSLAGEMSWTPQQLNKILKGKENLTLETICKLQRATGLTLIEAPYADIRAKVKQEAYKETLAGKEEITLFDFPLLPSNIKTSFAITDIFQEKMIIDSKDIESKPSTPSESGNHRLAMAA